MARRIAERDPSLWAMPSFDREHDDDQYDVIVVGAGIGGLTGAALLAKRGLKVLVLERQSRPGGYCSSWWRATTAGAYLFDAGVHDISGIGPKGPIRNLLRQLDSEGALDWLHVGREYLVDDIRLEVPCDAAGFVSVLSDRFPAERSGISRLFGEIEAVYREMYADVDRSGGVPRPPRTPQEQLEYPRTHPTLVEWFDRPFGEMVATFVHDARLRRLVSALSGYLSDNPSALTVGEMVPIFGYYFEGGFYPRGGSQALADVLVSSLVRCGGELRLGTVAQRIAVEGGRVSGVETGTGAFFRARVVVSNADVRRTYLELVGEQHLPQELILKIKAVTPSPSAFSVFLGVDFVPAVAPVTIISGSCTISIPSKVDPSLAPPGHASITLLRLISADESCCWDRTRSDYADRKRDLGDQLIARAEAAIPGLRSHVMHRQDASPATFARFSAATNGAIYGPARGQWRPSARSPITGLILAGAGVFPGSGVEGVVISGTLAADMVCPPATPVAPQPNGS